MRVLVAGELPQGESLFLIPLVCHYFFFQVVKPQLLWREAGIKL